MAEPNVPSSGCDTRNVLAAVHSLGSSIDKSAGALLLCGVFLLLYGSGALHVGSFSLEPSGSVSEAMRLIIDWAGFFIIAIAATLIVATRIRQDFVAFSKKVLTGFFLVLCGVLILFLVSTHKGQPEVNVVPEIYFDALTGYYDVLFEGGQLARYEGRPLVLAVKRESHPEIDVAQLDGWSAAGGAQHIGAMCRTPDLQLGEKLFGYVYVLPPGGNARNCKTLEELTCLPGAKQIAWRWQKVSVKESTAKNVLFVYSRLSASEREAADRQLQNYRSKEQLKVSSDSN